MYYYYFMCGFDNVKIKIYLPYNIIITYKYYLILLFILSVRILYYLIQNLENGVTNDHIVIVYLLRSARPRNHKKKTNR